MEIVLYTFSKRNNSTKRPDFDGLHLYGNLKNATSVINPAIVFTSLNNPATYNFAFIPVFNRFYFIDDWAYNAGTWVASMHVDVLASWRDDIGKSIQYVSRSSATFNTNIIDNVYPALPAAETITTTDVNPWAQTMSGGSYIIGIINNDGGAVGAVSYYVFDQGSFNIFKNILMGRTDWLNIADYPATWDEGILKAQFNPFQYVVSCIWLPFQANIGSSVLNKIPYGWWEIDLGEWQAERLLNRPTHQIVFSFTIPKHPQSKTRGKYLNAAPFSSYTVSIPPLGQIDLPQDVLYNNDTLQVSFSIDCVTGLANVDIAGYWRSTCQVGVSIKLAQMASDVVGMASGIVQTVSAGAEIAGGIGAMAISGGALGTGQIISGISGAAAGIGNALSSYIPKLSAAGNNGSFSAFGLTPRLIATFKHIVDELNEDIGRPLMRPARLDTLPGFSIIGHCDLQIAAMDVEIENIKTLLEGGYYFE